MTCKQLTILDTIEAHRRKEKGIKQAVTHADAVHEGWAEKAYQYALNYLANKSKGFQFLSENIRVMAEADGVPVPPSRRSWGAVILRIRKSGLIRSNGLTSTANPKAHSAWATRWEKL